MSTVADLPAPPARLRLLGAALGVVAVAAALPAPHAAAAPAPVAASVTTTATPEVYPVPADRVFHVQGHGYGHGRGLSQWGAQGAAVLGNSAATILSTYYPGTAAATVAPATLRVALTRGGVEGRKPTAVASDGRYECDSAAASTACQLEVQPVAGLTARIGTASPVALPRTVATGTVSRWRVLNDAAGMRLQHLVGSTWTTWGAATATGPVAFDSTAHEQAVYYASDRSTHVYRGTVSAVRVTGTRVVRVNTVAVEDYLRSVVPKESPWSWKPAALQAQSVAARSYALYSRGTRAGLPWEICDSTSCQVYAGRSVTVGTTTTPQEVASTDAAVLATANQVRTYGGKVVRAEFSSSNGGWSVSGGVAWLPSRADPWDATAGNTSSSWSADLPASAIESRFGLRRLDELVVLSRTPGGEWGGRVLDVELRGTDASGAARTVRTTGSGIAAVAPLSAGTGMRSSWFRPALPAAAELNRSAWATTAGAVTLVAPTASGSARVQGWSATSGLGAATALTGTLKGAPAVASRRHGDLEVFARGSDDALWTRTRTTTGWSAWRSLGGRISSRPAVARGAGQALVVFAVADGRVVQRTSTAPGTWSAWTSIGGTPAAGTAPAAVATGTDRLAVVVHGTDGTVWRRRAVGGTWGSWLSLGGQISGDPAVASADGELTVVVRGLDGTARTRISRTGDAWRTLGGHLASDPALAAAAGTGRVDLFITGVDGRLHRKVRTAAGWTSWSRAT